jgi:hypothetical protein
MPSEELSERIERMPSADEHRRIRRLWLQHSLSEDRRNIQGLMATLTEDCHYEYIETGDTWDGHEGATAFYLDLLGSFPDIHFELTNIVIGPQGVFEEAHVTATQEKDWLIYKENRGPVQFDVVIYFPWDPEWRLFSGERIQAFNFRKVIV